MSDRDDSRGSVDSLGVLSGRYALSEKLGSGGMADVYLARDEALGRLVAVKVLKSALAADAQLVERFRIEAHAAAQLNHPNIVAVYDRGLAGGAPFIAMEYVRGESLKERLRRDGALAPGDAVRIALQVLSALAAAHACDIVHRDITPYNVLLDERGQVKVADFGIARMGASALTRTGAMLGTSSYLSPEQAQGKPADGRSDLYSLGVVLYEMLTGQVPFRGETDLAVAMQHVSAAPPNPRSLAAGVSEPLAAVVMKALSKDPRDRFQSTAEFSAALRAAGGAPPAGTTHGGEPAVASPQPAVPASEVPTFVAADAATVAAMDVAVRPGEPRDVAPVVRPRRRRHRRLLIVVACLAAAVVGAWAVYAFGIAAGARVPNVVGRERQDAVAMLRDEGLRPRVHYVWADAYADGVVARQVPRARKEVETGVRVDLWVSRGPLHVPAPVLRGLGASAARRRLEAQSLNGRSRKAASLTAPRGEIFKQKPAAGETVARGDTVTFWVSSGPPLIPVPDVLGLSQPDAVAVLEDAGFVVDTNFSIAFGEYPGDVIAQDPAAGTRARVGDEIVIEVAVF